MVKHTTHGGWRPIKMDDKQCECKTNHCICFGVLFLGMMRPLMHTIRKATKQVLNNILGELVSEVIQL